MHLKNQQLIAFCGLVIYIALFLGCNRIHSTSINFEDYKIWMSKEENGLIKKRSFHGLEYSMIYLPTNYLEYQNHLKGLINSKVDSNLHFVMKVSLKDKNPDLLYLGISSLDEYRERILELNFGIDSLLQMTINDKVYKPVLTSFENTYGISPYASVNLVFILPKEIKKQDEIDISFRDEIFQTGIQHFLFDYQQLKNIPKIK